MDKVQLDILPAIPYKVGQDARVVTIESLKKWLEQQILISQKLKEQELEKLVQLENTDSSNKIFIGIEIVKCDQEIAAFNLLLMQLQRK